MDSAQGAGLANNRGEKTPLELDKEGQQQQRGEETRESKPEFKVDIRSQHKVEGDGMSPLDLERETVRQTRVVNGELDRAQFLEAIREGYSITWAAKNVGLSRRTCLGWREDPEFEVAFQDAKESSGDHYVDLNKAAAERGSMAAIFNALRMSRRLQPDGINVSSGSGAISFTLSIGDAREDPEQLPAPSVGGYLVDPGLPLLDSGAEGRGD